MAFLETLESRVFFSATAAQAAAEIKTVKNDEGKLRAIVSQVGAQLSKDIGIVKSELSHLGVSKTQASLIATAVTGEKALGASLKTDVKFYFPELNTEAAKLVSDNKKLAKKPSADLRDQIEGDDAALGTVSIYGNVPFTYGSEAPTFYSDLDAIVAANPSSTKLTTEVNTIGSGMAALLSKAQVDAGTLYDTDIGNVEDLYPY